LVNSRAFIGSTLANCDEFISNAYGTILALLRAGFVTGASSAK
jgi:hypothetical protein